MIHHSYILPFYIPNGSGTAYIVPTLVSRRRHQHHLPSNWCSNDTYRVRGQTDGLSFGKLPTWIISHKPVYIIGKVTHGEESVKGMSDK